MDFLECKICHVPYDEEEHRPRHAPCGHEICTACIGALIKDSIFECPKCRQKNKIDAPNNMPINFGLIDVIRAFKSKRIPMAKETDSSASGASNEEMCIIHCKSLTHWCFKCQIWICKECIEAHTSLVGCTTASAPKAMENMKEKHNKSMDILLATFEQDTKYMAFNIKELNDKKRELLEKAEKCGEEAQKIYNVLEQGENHKEMLVESTNLLNETTSRTAFSEKIKVATQRKQILHTWSIKNLATNFSNRYSSWITEGIGSSKICIHRNGGQG
ncbi:unnamed protein product [Meganyctiphanes norvegica]|uniref:RING-type domain-containing protein n=1 Tax=Meganyctiphanes norvegica TaxID=48144 RepID=A0AAV2QIL1_MEGNR